MDFQASASRVALGIGAAEGVEEIEFCVGFKTGVLVVVGDLVGLKAPSPERMSVRSSITAVGLGVFMAVSSTEHPRETARTRLTNNNKAFLIGDDYKRYVNLWLCLSKKIGGWSGWGLYYIPPPN